MGLCITMTLRLVFALLLVAGLTAAELLGSGTGANSCSAPPYRARWVAFYQGCPASAASCNEYGYCKTQEAWNRGEFRDCNGISNGFALPDSTVKDEQNAAAQGDPSGLRLVQIPRDRQFFQGIVGGISSGVGGILGGIGAAVGGIASGVGGAVGGIASGVGGAIGGVASGAGNAVGGVASGVGNTVGGVSHGVGTAVGGVAGGVGQAVGGVAQGTGNFVGGVAQGTGNVIGGGVNGVGSAIGGGAASIRPFRQPQTVTTGSFTRPVYRPNYYRPTTFTTVVDPARPVTFVSRPTTTVSRPTTITTVVDPARPVVTSVQKPVSTTVTYQPFRPATSTTFTKPVTTVVKKPVSSKPRKVCKDGDNYYLC